MQSDLATLHRAVRRLVRAEISNAWKGAGDPADIPDTEAELKAAKADYKAKLDALSDKVTELEQVREG